MANEPLINKTAFDCPHCGAYTSQYWFQVFTESYKKGVTPRIPKKEAIEKINASTKLSNESKEHAIDWINKMLTRKPFFESSDVSHYGIPIIHNISISRCYNCNEITIWVHEQIVYPSSKIDIKPNDDLHEHVKQLFNEAREIVNSSPKGAAALLRLAIQYLCIELGESGKILDSDIANLVSKGLNPLVQKALDVVRVIGNESVHPGEIDLNDNREIAIKLFDLINLICNQMISHPKSINEMYKNLPPNKLEGIKKRDKKSKQ